MVVLVLVSPILPSKNNFVKALRKKFPEISTVVINVNDRKTSMGLGERNITVYGKGFIEDELCGCTFRISPTSFYQVNPQQTERLYKKAISCAKLTGKETVIDAYCGTGTIGLIASSTRFPFMSIPPFFCILSQFPSIFQISERISIFSASLNHKKEKQPQKRLLFGGDKRDRTADLLTASQALSQLSYTPEPEHSIV